VAAAAVAYAAGGGVVLAGLVAWLGGAVLTLAAAAIATGRRSPPDRDASHAGRDAALARAIARWEQDRLGDKVDAPRSDVA